MKSRIDTEADMVIVSLTGDECMVLVNGGTVTDRNNPFDPSAKVDVRQLADIDPDYRPKTISDPNFLKQLGNTICRAVVLGNSDIIIYVPREVVVMSNISAEVIRVANITGDPSVIPSGGIRAEFGSLIE